MSDGNPLGVPSVGTPAGMPGAKTGASSGGVPGWPRVWFFDTCTLMNMQSCADLDALVQKQMSGEDCVLLQEVVDELNFIASRGGAGSALAGAALGNLGWLPTPEPASAYANLGDIVYWQDLIADGRTLKHPREHWAESCIIAAVEVLPEESGAAVFMSDEYAARVHADSHAWCTAFSVHRYLWQLVKDEAISEAEALDMANELHAAGRGIECKLSDFTDPTPRGLGRPGQP